MNWHQDKQISGTPISKWGAEELGTLESDGSYSNQEQFFLGGNEMLEMSFIWDAMQVLSARDYLKGT